jgi:hypothetical protein
MESLHELTAADAVWTIAGRELRFAPLRLCDYGVIERRIVAARVDPLEPVRPRLEGLSEPLQRHLLGAAYDELRRGERVSLAELNDWLATLAGQLDVFWLSLRRGLPDLTRDEAELLFDAALAQRADLPRLLRAAGGAPLGNSWGQARVKEATCRGASSSAA